MCDTEAEEQSDAEDTSVNESLSQSQLDTSTDKSADDAKLASKSPALKVASPVQQAMPPVAKIASPVQQVTLCVA